MFVYVVLSSFADELELEEVFATEQAAMKYCEEKNKGDYHTHYTYRTKRVESE